MLKMFYNLVEKCNMYDMICEVSVMAIKRILKKIALAVGLMSISLGLVYPHATYAAR